MFYILAFITYTAFCCLFGGAIHWAIGEYRRRKFEDSRTRNIILLSGIKKSRP